MGKKIMLPRGFMLLGMPIINNHSAPYNYADLVLETSFGNNDSKKIIFISISEKEARVHIDHRDASSAIASSEKALKFIIKFLLKNVSAFPNRAILKAANQVAAILRNELLYRISRKMEKLDILNPDNQKTLRIIAASLNLHREAEQFLP